MLDGLLEELLREMIKILFHEFAQISFKVKLEGQTKKLI